MRYHTWKFHSGHSILFDPDYPSSAFLLGKIWQEFFEQRRKIAGEIDAALRKKNQVAICSLVQTTPGWAEQSRMEGKKIIQDAVARAKVEKKHIVDQADVEAQALKDKAKPEIVRWKREAQEQLKVQAASLAVDLAGKLF